MELPENESPAIDAEPARRIKEARMNAGLSQRAMSRELGIPCRTIENWESGQRTPPSWAVELIVDRLNCMIPRRGINNSISKFNQAG